MRQLLSIDDLTAADILRLTECGSASVSLPATPQPMRGTLAFLFQQPSLRTLSGFARAGVQLGLAPVAAASIGGQLRERCDIHDDIEQLALTSSCVVARCDRPLDRDALSRVTAPVVNGGDGINEHPSQALVDIAAMRSFGLEGRRVVLMGNLRDHRVHHSLAKALHKLNVPFAALCPAGFEMGPSYLAPGKTCAVTASPQEVDEVLHTADFVYVTPIASYGSPELPGMKAYKLDAERARRVLKPTAKIFHPFPRLDELARDLDETEFNAYHLQTRLGPGVRYGLLRWLVDGISPHPSRSTPSLLAVAGTP